MSIVHELGDLIANLTPSEAGELRTFLKDKYDIEAPAGGVKVEPDKKEEVKEVEPTEFDVVLDGFDPTKKIGLIKVVRELTGQGLGEAKATVEGPAYTLKQAVDKKTADDLKATVEAAGGKVVVKTA